MEKFKCDILNNFQTTWICPKSTFLCFLLKTSFSSSLSLKSQIFCFWAEAQLFFQKSLFIYTRARDEKCNQVNHWSPAIFLLSITLPPKPQAVGQIFWKSFGDKDKAPLSKTGALKKRFIQLYALFEIFPKCLVRIFQLWHCPIKTDLSGNTVWP